MDRFYNVFPIDKKSAETIFISNDVERICFAMVAVALHEGDWKWAQDKILTCLMSNNPDISGLAATCLGHLARVHGHIEREKVLPLLKSRLKYSEISGRVEDALNDIEMFTGGGNG